MDPRSGCGTSQCTKTKTQYHNHKRNTTIIKATHNTKKTNTMIKLVSDMLNNISPVKESYSYVKLPPVPPWLCSSWRTYAASVVEVLKPCFSTCGRTPWTGGQPITRCLPTQARITPKHKDKHPCLE
jgi:hypothetical protein